MAEAKTLEDALLRVQSDLKNPKVDKSNPHFGNKYVSLSALLDDVRPVLSKNGLVLSQGVEKLGDDWVLFTHIVGASGSLENIVPLVPERQGSQGMGSALTYARRQGLCALLGLAGEDDDDGNGAEVKTDSPHTSERSGDYKLTEKQAKMLHVICDVAEVDEGRIKGDYEVEHFSELTKGAMDEIISMLVKHKKIIKDRTTGRYVKPEMITEEIVKAIGEEFDEATFDDSPF